MERLTASVRPIVTYALVATACIISVYGVVVNGQWEYALAIFGLANLVVAFYFARREREKADTATKKLLMDIFDALNRGESKDGDIHR